MDPTIPKTLALGVAYERTNGWFKIIEKLPGGIVSSNASIEVAARIIADEVRLHPGSLMALLGAVMDGDVLAVEFTLSEG